MTKGELMHHVNGYLRGFKDAGKSLPIIAAIAFCLGFVTGGSMLLAIQ